MKKILLSLTAGVVAFAACKKVADTATTGTATNVTIEKTVSATSGLTMTLDSTGMCGHTDSAAITQQANHATTSNIQRDGRGVRVYRYIPADGTARDTVKICVTGANGDGHRGPGHHGNCNGQTPTTDSTVYTLHMTIVPSTN